MIRKTVAILSALVWAGIASADIIYSNDFTGASGGAIAAAAGVGSDLFHGFAHVELDGAGCLVPTTSDHTSIIRMKLSETGLSTEGYEAFVMTTTMAKPTTGWVGLAFSDAAGSANSIGFPWMMVNSAVVSVRGGEGNTGALTDYSIASVSGPLTLQMTYYSNNTVDLSVNGVEVFDGEAISPTATPSIVYLTLQFRDQPLDGSMFIDNVVVEAIPEPASVGLMGIAALTVVVFRRASLAARTPEA